LSQWTVFGPTTPALDALAAQGVSFARAYSTAGHTAMSFPGILLSNFFQNFGRSRSVPAHLTTLAEALSAGGFRTVAYNAGNVQVSRFYGYDRGFDEFHDFVDERTCDAESFELARMLDEASVQALMAECRARPQMLEMIAQLTGLKGDALVRHVAEHRRFYPCNAADLVKLALADLRRPRGRRRFYWLHLMDVHEDITVPFSRLGSFTPGEQLFLNICADSPAGRMALAGRPQRYLDLYDSAVSYVDMQLEILHNFLADAGLLDHSLICVTADHGQALFEDGLFGHGFRWLTEKLVHVPLVFGGGLAGGIRPDAPPRAVSTLDVGPTILDVCGVEQPASFLGRSLNDPRPRPALGQSFYSGARNRTDDADIWRFYLSPFPRPVREWARQMFFSIEGHQQLICDVARGSAVVYALTGANGEPANARGMLERAQRYFDQVYHVPQQQEVTQTAAEEQEVVATRLQHLGYL